MKPALDHDLILNSAGKLLNQKITKQELAIEGADNIVFKVWSENGNTVIVKTGSDASTDAYVLNILKGTNIKVPKLLAETRIKHDGKEYGLLVMSCFKGKLLKEVPREENYKFIKSIIEEISKAHKLKSPGKAGYVLKVVNGDGWAWKDFLLRSFVGGDPDFDWEKVYKHKNVDKRILEKAIKSAINKIQELKDDMPLFLVNTDLNQSNIFIKNGKLEGIIDWSDSIYGDPLFDFARLRMNITHRMDENALKEYYSTLNLSDQEKTQEEIYYSLHLIMYVNHFVDYGWDEIVGLQMKLVEANI